MKKLLKKIWNAFTTLLVCCVFVLAVLLGFPRFVDIQPLVVLSGSMEPVFLTGSLVYVQKTETETLETGDVITFYQDDETVVTHRIIEIVTDEELSGGVKYRTKGDANEMEDAFLVPPENVIGKAMFSVPYLGYLAQYIQQPPGLYIAIVIGAGLILLMFLPDLFSDEEGKEKEKEKKDSGGVTIYMIDYEDPDTKMKPMTGKELKNMEKKKRRGPLETTK